MLPAAFFVAEKDAGPMTANPPVHSGTGTHPLTHAPHRRKARPEGPVHRDGHLPETVSTSVFSKVLTVFTKVLSVFTEVLTVFLPPSRAFAATPLPLPSRPQRGRKGPRATKKQRFCFAVHAACTNFAVKTNKELTI